MTHVVQAGAEELIWIVVGIFWVVAQIAGGAAKKKMAPPRPMENNEGAEPVGDPFADLIRKLSGVQEFKIPTPPAEPRSELRSARKPKEMKVENPWKPGDIEALPDMQPLQRTVPALEPVQAMKPIQEIAEVDIRPTMSAFRNSLPAMRLPSMKLHFQCATHHDRDVDSGKDVGRIERLKLKDRATFRRAMLSHIILGKPKAMGG